MPSNSAYKRAYYLANKDRIHAQANERNKKNRAKLREKEKDYIATPRGKLWNRNKKLKAKYGIDHDEYLVMEAKQSGLCAICGGPQNGSSKTAAEYLEIDHDHETGILRELLCSRCNRMIGLAKDNPEILRNAALYLEKHRELSV